MRKKFLRQVSISVLFIYLLSLSVSSYASINGFASLPNLVNAVGTVGAIGSQSSFLATSAVTTTQSVYTQNEVTSSVFSLPTDTVIGQLGATIYGNTGLNLLCNKGNCEDIGKCWFTGNITEDLVVKESGNKSFKVISSNNTPHFAFIDNVNKLESRYYLLSGSVNIKSYSAGFIAIRLTDSNYKILGEALANTSIQSKFQKLAVKIDAGSVTDGKLKVICGSLYTNNTSEVNYDNISLIPISESDYTNETTDHLLEKYQSINNDISESPIRIKSLGANLVKNGDCEYGLEDWNKSTTVAFSIYKESFKISALNNIGAEYIYKDIRVKPNTNYYISSNLLVNSNIRIFSMDGYCLKDGVGSFNNGNRDTIRIVIYCKSIGDGYFREVMLIEGTQQPASYVSYNDSTTYTPNNVILCSLNSEIRDEINLKQNTLIKKTGKVDIGTSTGFQNFNNVDFKTIVYASVANWAGTNNSLISTKNLLSGNNDVVFIPTLYFVDSGMPQVAITSDGKLWYAIPKEKIGGTTGYSNDLNGFVKNLTDNKTTLIYQLAQPQTYKISTQSLLAYPGGTVVVEPVVKDSATYTSTGISIFNKGLPVSFIESVYKLNGSIMMPVDLSKVHLSTNGTSFTIDGAKSGEVYEYVYQYDKSLTTLPTINYTVTKDSTQQINGIYEMVQKQNDIIELLKQELELLKSERLTQYEYDANGRLVKKAKQ